MYLKQQLKRLSIFKRFPSYALYCKRFVKPIEEICEEINIEILFITEPLRDNYNRERIVILLKFLDFTYEEIGEYLFVSSERIRQIYSKGLTLLSGRIRDKWYVEKYNKKCEREYKEWERTNLCGNLT